jgi:hypothetical protein
LPYFFVTLPGGKSLKSFSNTNVFASFIVVSLPQDAPVVPARDAQT